MPDDLSLPIYQEGTPRPSDTNLAPLTATWDAGLDPHPELASWDSKLREGVRIYADPLTGCWCSEEAALHFERNDMLRVPKYMVDNLKGLVLIDALIGRYTRIGG